MYKCLVIEDNLIERDALLLQLTKIKNVEVVAACDNGIDALDILKTQKLDFVISDIDLPDISGIGIIKSIPHKPVFIFISSHPEYAIEGFNLDVLDFIEKPVTLERVAQAIYKATEYIELKKLKKESLSTDTFHKNDDFFFVKEDNGYTKVQISGILYIESMGDFSRIYSTQSKKNIVLISLKNLEKQLQEKGFKRVHKQYIVNINQVAAVKHSEIFFPDGQFIPVSISYKKEIITLLENKTLKRF